MQKTHIKNTKLAIVEFRSRMYLPLMQSTALLGFFTESFVTQTKNLPVQLAGPLGPVSFLFT